MPGSHEDPGATPSMELFARPRKIREQTKAVADNQDRSVD